MTAPRWEIGAPGSWELDSAHFPSPITPYHATILCEQFPRGFAAGSERVGILLSHFEHRIVRGFDYISPRVVGAPAGARRPPPRPVFTLVTKLHPAVRRRLRTASTVLDRRPWRDDVKLWESEVRPASTATHLRLQRTDVAALDDARLGEHLRALRANAEHQYFLHHRFTVSALVPIGDFLVHAREWTGLSDGELLQACRQPGGLASVAGEHFAALADALGRDDAARELLEGAPSAGEALARLRSATGRTGSAARAWLELTEHRLVTGYDIADLTAGEMPDLLLRTLLAAADDPRQAERERLRAERAAAVRDRVPAGHRGEYDELLAEALSVSNLREERALVCDFWAYGLVRRAVQEAGRRLAERGVVADPAHLFDAGHEEMLALLAGEAGPPADELAERHAWRTTATADLAPPRIGPPPAAPPPADWLPVPVRRMGAAVDAAVHALFTEPEPRNEPTTVRGLAASAGTFVGTARVVLDPAGFGRVRHGDVLVSRMTTEAYNGLLPLLGAVVTDRGGLLSHAATVAREFGIPAVVGTREATRLIPDGARVRVDGDRGEARLL